MNDEVDLLPRLDWKLRVSRRARYARLLIKPFGGLEVVIPPRFPRGEVPALVARHANWARQQLDKQSKLRDSICLPQSLSLAFDNSVTTVKYSSDLLQFNFDLFARQADYCLVIDASDHQGRIRELRAWIRRRAWDYLPQRLDAVAAATGLNYKRLSIRSQKTRWGSCSSRGNISLNDQLLFLPAKAVDYLMIHELCHTRHLNHSKAFWALVEYHCPEFRTQEKLLSRPRNLVPDWFLLDLYV